VLKKMRKKEERKKWEKEEIFKGKQRERKKI
jgi:hypothetical protein